MASGMASGMAAEAVGRGGGQEGGPQGGRGGAAADYDVFVVGGGINGAGIARDAVGRGYRVGLAEMNDLASGTSSWSTKLIHGGLRYLEHYEFRLVREALKEREVLWGMAPHIIRPLRFVLPYHKGLRPAWLLRIGLFLYDHIGGRKALPATTTLDLRTDPAGEPLNGEYDKGFEYSDCWVEDTRLVILNARDAADRGADVMVRTKVENARREGERWVIALADRETGERREVTARMLVNAAGPWVDRVLGSTGYNGPRNVRLVQGSHIVVPKLYDHDRAYIFQNADGRVFFAIPYERDFTLVGTTDRDYTDDPADVAISDEEVDYIIEGANGYFAEPVRREDMVWSYSGVRPLFDDGASAAQEATRDYVLKLDGRGGEGGDGAPLLNVFGGKLTTYRRLAESALELIDKGIGARGRAWTRGAALPGGDFPVTGYDAQVAKLRGAHPFLREDEAGRLTRLYGTVAGEFLAGTTSEADLGERFGDFLTAVEVRHLMLREWARTADDVLWRRSKEGLRASEADEARLADFMANERRGMAPEGTVREAAE